MVYYSIRKSYRFVKFCAILTLTSGILVLWLKVNSKRLTIPKGLSTIELVHERQIQDDEARIVPGLGEGGAPVFLEGEEKKLGEESYKKNAMNVFLSDRIAYNRNIPDWRVPACLPVQYDAELPAASIIIVFHDEPFSVLARTLWSVATSVRRHTTWFHKTKTGGSAGYPGQDPSSAHVYVREILVVDDASTAPALQARLDYYVRTRMPSQLIHILRLPDRVGLIRAKMFGARAAKGDVLVYLDAHCEVSHDWLRPLLQRVKDSRTAVVMPIIDDIDGKTFQYTGWNPDDIQSLFVAGFTFEGEFVWMDLSQREYKRRGSNIAPTWSPTMAGGLYAMDRKYFWQLGGYDVQMSGWGGENLEMSFRVWQCGGTLETIPCSRVGHVFRSFQPYKLPKDVYGINTARMAEVWMDEYAELFYMYRPDLRKNWTQIGSVEPRRALRKQLQCRNFKWYLDNVYPEKYIPIRDAFGFGRFRNPSTGLCLDSPERDHISALRVSPCHDKLSVSQDLSLSLTGELRTELDCAEIEYLHNFKQGNSSAQEEMARLMMVSCGKVSQKSWRYLRSRQLKHTRSGLCVDAGFRTGADALARKCRHAAAAPSQVWLIEHNKDGGFFQLHQDDSQERSDRIKKLLALRKKPGSLRGGRKTKLPATIPHATGRGK